MVRCVLFVVCFSLCSVLCVRFLRFAFVLRCLFFVMCCLLCVVVVRRSSCVSCRLSLFVVCASLVVCCSCCLVGGS